MTIKKIFKKTNFRGGLRSCSSRIRGRVFRAFGKCTIFSENKRRRSFPAWEMCRFFPSVRCVCVLRAVCSACSDISVTENSFTKLFDWEFFGRSFLRAFSFFSGDLPDSSEFRSIFWLFRSPRIWLFGRWVFLNFDVSCFFLRFYIFIDFESSLHNYLCILLCVIQNTNVGICYFTNYLMSSFWRFWNL